MAHRTELDASVVVPTRDRAGRLRRLLDSLRAQTLGREVFEVIVVDDGSSDRTADVLEAERSRGGLELRVIRRDSSGGPASARNEGWRAARAPLVAFTDDDCVADPAWLEAGIRAAREHPGAIVQGRTEPDSEEWKDFNPFAHTLNVPEPTPWFETCNVFYPRELLERHGGFDERFPSAAGEDGDLAWRAIEAGAGQTFADEALVHHAVLNVGPLGKLRIASRRSEAITALARHPGLRRRHLRRGILWDHHHELFLRALVALLLPRRLGLVRLWLAAPYIKHLTDRRSGPLLAPYLALLDAVEVLAVVRGGLRNRVLVL